MGNENKTIEELLNSLTGLVGGVKTTLFGQDKCMVDRNEILSLIDQIRNALPQELSEAKVIVENCDALRTNAKKDAAQTRKNADQVMREAEERAAKLVEEHTIVAVAQKQADNLIEEAEDKSRKLMQGAIDFANTIMANTENVIESTYNGLFSGLTALKKQAEDQKQEPLQQLDAAKKAMNKDQPAK